MRKVIVVESAAKTKTIRRFLAGEYEVIACGGHIVDLPDDDLGIDVENNFRTTRVPIEFRGRDKVRQVSGELSGADEIFLATDPDREGEAIAADLLEHCTPDSSDVQRIEFNAIVYRAVREALESPRGIDERRVEAQRARRTLDRLIGFVISSMTQFDPEGPGLPSAGRVLAPAVSLVVDREKEVEEFTPRHYWSLHAELESEKESLETVVDADWDEFEEAKEVAGDLLDRGEMQVTDFEVDPEDEFNPLPPYTTDTLQEDADELLNFTPEQTMELAQELYQGVEVDGTPRALITYMRTDSTRVSPQALNQASEALEKRFDEDFYSGRPWRPQGEEQDAHEAIRPTSPEEEEVAPEKLQGEMDEDLHSLYRLIYFRFLASQSVSALYRTTEISFEFGDYGATALGHKLLRPGFLKLYRKIQPEFGRQETDLPEIQEGQMADVKRAWPEPEQTYPPPRYREGSLVRALKEKGIGRPSTYGDILEKIKQGRGGFGYVDKSRGKLRPTEKGRDLCDYLRRNYEQVISYEYTASMERKLDKIEQGESSYQEFLESEFEWLEEPYKLSEKKGWLSGDRPTPAQVKFLNRLASRTGEEVPEEVYDSKPKTSEWIEKLQDAVEPIVKLTGVEEVDVNGVNCFRFMLQFNEPLPEEEKEYLKAQKMKYRQGSEERLPGYQFQRQDYETVEALRKELSDRYSGPDSPVEARLVED